jgi:hypothetical protein
MRRLLAHYDWWKQSKPWKRRQQRVDGFRNRWLAHRQVGSPLSKAQSSGATIADALWLLGAASYFVKELHRVGTTSVPDHRSHRRLRTRFATAFWHLQFEQSNAQISDES